MVTALIRALNGVTDWTPGDSHRQPGAASVLLAHRLQLLHARCEGAGHVDSFGPEFGIHDAASAVGRANLVYTLVYFGYSADTSIPSATGTKLFLAPFEEVADQPPTMVSRVQPVPRRRPVPRLARTHHRRGGERHQHECDADRTRADQPRPYGRLPDGLVLRLPGAALTSSSRKFLTSTGALTASALAGNLATWGVKSAEAQAASGYKAIVAVFLFGAATRTT